MCAKEKIAFFGGDYTIFSESLGKLASANSHNSHYFSLLPSFICSKENCRLLLIRLTEAAFVNILRKCSLGIFSANKMECCLFILVVYIGEWK